MKNKRICYMDKPYLDKRKILRQYSTEIEIDNIVSLMTDVIYNNIMKNFDSSYFKDTNIGEYELYNYIKILLIDGYISFEILYDDTQKNIIGINPIDPLTLIMTTDKDNDQEVIWIQNPDDEQNRRVLSDSQIIYISYTNSNGFGSTSYVEDLIRPYNQYKLMVDSMLKYNINLASQKQLIKSKKSDPDSKKYFTKLIQDFNDDIFVDEKTGELLINNNSMLPKRYFISDDEIEFEFVSNTNPSMIVDLEWFRQNLNRASKIPLTILEGGEVESNDIRFNNFVERMVLIVGSIFIKIRKIKNQL